ncbi:hypothetical protein [Treponema sp.]|uniref:hypothetical protein n=1 Tax=Treponema sp. TaxID=166 RepID=UPI0025FB1ECA|nr:hypothetical protein [Treponema sp.]MCR5217592.1 hypothetical protein [Treponema sp.]
MITLLVGLILIGFCVYSCLPFGALAWGSYIIDFLKGFAPVFAAFLGLIAVCIGLADLKDKREAKRENKEASEK